MANPSKKKGTAAETKVVKYLKDHGIEAKRKPLAGNKDEGDIQMIEQCYGQSVTLEVKTGKMTQNYNRSQFKEWMRQAVVEGENADQPSLLVIVRYNRKIEDAEVWMQGLDDQCTRMYLDDFAKMVNDKRWW